MNDTILLNSTPEEFEAIVAAAFKAYREGDLLSLAASPLAHSALTEELLLPGEAGTPTLAGQLLQSLLRWAVDRLRPEGEMSWVKPAWRNYNILYHFYLEGMRASTLAEAMAIAEQTLYLARPQAVAAVAQVIRSELTQPRDAVSRKAMSQRDRYNRHTPTAQLVLRLAAVFPSAAPAAVLHELANALGGQGLAEALQELTSARLLLSDEQHSEFAVHPLLRAFLLPLLSLRERRRAHRLAARFYSEQESYLEAARQWRSAGEHEPAARLLIERQREIIDNLQIEELDELLTRFRSNELSAETWARVKILAGEVAEFTRNLEAALNEYQQALSSTERSIKALAYYRRAKVFERINIDESLAHYTYCIGLLEPGGASLLPEKALERPDQHTERLALLVDVYIARAWIHLYARPNPSQAEADLLAAQALLRQDDLPGRNERLCDLANALGEYYHQINDAERSIAHYWQAWLIANELLDRERMSKTAHNLGLVYMDHLHEYERSLEYLSKSRDLAEQTGNRQMEGLSAVSLGACYYWLGDFVRAIEHYQAAAAIFRETGNRTYLGHTYYGLAEAYAQVEAPDEMYRYYAAALTIAREQNNQNALRNLAELAHLHPQLAATHADGGWQLNQRQKLALEHIRQHGSIHNRVYQQLTGVAQKQAVRDLNELVEHGWLRRIGQGRATRYEMK